MDFIVFNILFIKSGKQIKPLEEIENTGSITVNNYQKFFLTITLFKRLPDRAVAFVLI